MLGVACNASASVLVKVAASAPRRPLSLTHPVDSLGNFPLISGLALYGLAFLLYAMALARLPLNVVHPVLTCGSIAIVALSSALLFHEPFPLTRVIGIGLVLVGVGLISTSMA